MRDRLIGELGELAHPQLLVSLMGPYKTFDVETLLEAVETKHGKKSQHSLSPLTPSLKAAIENRTSLTIDHLADARAIK